MWQLDVPSGIFNVDPNVGLSTGGFGCETGIRTVPKKVPEMSALDVRRIDRIGFNAVGGVSGLYLRVRGPQARSWTLRLMIAGKRRDVGLGGFPDVTLAQARNKARLYRDLVAEGRDPQAERKAARKALIVAQAKRITFAEAATRCYAAKAAEFRNAKHSKQWISSLEHYAFPLIGDQIIGSIDLPLVLQVLEPIWKTKTETATRVRQRMESVLTWATVGGYREGDNPARWKGNLSEVLPKPDKIRTRKHFTALPWKELPTFMVELRKRPATAARALEFAILTASRSGEVRGATWDEIDFDEQIWRIPDARMKAGKSHSVPLSHAAITLLNALPRFAESNLIFPSTRTGKLSDMSLTALLKRMNVRVTAHGFRSTFKDWARSTANYPDEVSELALAHVSSDATRAAYARDELLPQRRLQLEDWAAFANALPAKALT